MSRISGIWKVCRSLGIALVILLSGVLASQLFAQPSSQWAGEGRDDLLKAAAVEALKKTMPGAEYAFNIADWGVDPLVAASTTPGTTEQKIDAWVRALGQAGVNAAFPAYGFVLAGGKIVIGGATYTVEGMIQTTHDAQIMAILAGTGEGGPFDRVGNVLADMPFTSVLNADVRLENIGYLTRDELDRKWTFYATKVRDIYGRSNADVVNTEVWPKLLAMWETQRAKANLEKVVGQLDRALAEAKVKADAQAAAATDNTATGGDTNIPTEGTDYYVFVLTGIGLVVATPDDVRTRPACQWSGGGPPPCTTPATAERTLGGPYPSVDAARADMKTKLDCQRGYWGTFLMLGASKAWLQNNIGGDDCRSLKQL